MAAGLAIGVLALFLWGTDSSDSTSSTAAATPSLPAAGPGTTSGASTSSSTTAGTDTTSASATTAPPTTSAPTTPQAGSWAFTGGEGSTDCGGIFVVVPPGPTQQGTLEVLDGGTRLRVEGIGDEYGTVEAEIVDPTPGATVYEGGIAPEDAVEGVDLVFTITFDTPDHGTTHIGGSIGSEGATCDVDRPGVAERVG